MFRKGGIDMHKFVELLKTPRRSVVALCEAKVLKDYISKKGKCINCHEECSVDNASPRHNGACKKCGAVYDNMLSIKNKLIRGEQVGSKALRGYLDNLKNCRYLPASLRGLDTMDNLIEYMEDYIAGQALEDCTAAAANVSPDVLRLLEDDEDSGQSERD